MQVLEELSGELRYANSSYPDGRKGRPDNIEIADEGMAAFSLFYAERVLLIASVMHGRNASNCKTLFGIEKILGDNHIRDPLEPAPPELLEPCFKQMLE